MKLKVPMQAQIQPANQIPSQAIVAKNQESLRRAMQRNDHLTKASEAMREQFRVLRTGTGR